MANSVSLRIWKEVASPPQNKVLESRLLEQQWSAYIKQPWLFADVVHYDPSNPSGCMRAKEAFTRLWGNSYALAAVSLSSVSVGSVQN